MPEIADTIAERLRRLTSESRSPVPRNRWRRYGAAALAWSGAFALTAAAAPVIEHAIFVFFWGAVLFAAWYSGFVPALISAVAAVLAVNFLLLPPQGILAVPSVSQLLTLAIFIVVTSVVSVLTARLAEEQRQSHERAAELAALAEQLQEQQIELEQQTEEAQALTEEAEAANDDLVRANALLERANVALAESEGRWHSLANAAPVLVWTAGTDGLRDWFNQSWLAFTGRTMPEEVGTGWTHGVHPDDLARCINTYETAFAARRDFAIEYRLRRFDGTYRWMLATGAPRIAPDGTFAGYVATCLDVTPLHEAREEAVRARTEAEAANEAKMQFLRAMSHELRTPLSAIQGYAHLLRDGMVGDISTGQQVHLDRIIASSRHLTDVVDEILTYARLEAGTEVLRVEPGVSVDDLARDAAAMVEPVAAGKGLEFQVDAASGAQLTTDGPRVRQVLVNLLSNAAKFTYRGRVALTVEAEDDEVRFVVQDTGVGIAPEQLDRIWEPFWQANQQLTRQVGGAGLGLALSRRLARLLGGEIDVQSTRDEGSTFVFRLPRNEARMRSPSVVAGSASSIEA